MAWCSWVACQLIVLHGCIYAFSNKGKTTDDHTLFFLCTVILWKQNPKQIHHAQLSFPWHNSKIKKKNLFDLHFYTIADPKLLTEHMFSSSKLASKNALKVVYLIATCFFQIPPQFVS